MQQRKSRQAIDCRDFIFGAVSLLNNKLEGAKGEYSGGFLTDSPSKKSNNATLMKLAKLEEKLKKRLAEVKATAPVPSGVKYTTTQTNTKDKLMIASEGVTDCRSVVHITITKEEPELVVIYPEDNLREQKNIEGTNPPTMPTMSIKARLKNYDEDVSFYITFTKLQWTAPGTNPQKITKGYFEGNKTGNGEVEIPFTLPAGYVRGGDDMTIDLRAVAGGKTYQTNLENPFKIQGLNPLRATLYAVLGEDIYAAVAWKESSFRQFNGSPGFPLQGVDPNDIGVMGLRGDLLNDDRIWNWVSNAQAGKDYFINRCMARANNYHTFNYFSKYDPKPTPLNNDIHSTNKNQNQVFLEAYCIYNTGDPNARYWDWVLRKSPKGYRGKMERGN